MKKIVLLFVMLNLFQHLCKAQTTIYHQFPDSNAVWVNGYYDVVYYPPSFYDLELSSVTNFCVDGTDTVINSTSYTKLKYCDGYYKGALRDDNGKIYYVPFDSINEFLLYDFTLEPGDTLKEYYFEYSSLPNLWTDDIIITDYDIDSVLINGDYRRIIYVGQSGWIEGIGCTQGLLAESYGNVSMYGLVLLCMSENDSTLYPDVSASSCDLDISIDAASTMFSMTINLFPNPARTSLTIQSPEQITSLKIIDITGREIQAVTLSVVEGQTTADISHLQQGVYVFIINGSAARKVVVE